MLVGSLYPKILECQQSANQTKIFIVYLGFWPSRLSVWRIQVAHCQREMLLLNKLKNALINSKNLQEIMFKMSVLLALVGLGMEFWDIDASSFAAGEGIYLAGEERLWDLGQSDRVSSLHSPALPWTGTLHIEPWRTFPSLGRTSRAHNLL